MCKAIKAVDFRNEVIRLAKDKDRNLIFDYLRSIGCVINNRDGKLAVDDEWNEKLKFMTSEIQTGDIIWTVSEGMTLVIDARPAVNNDGKHYRVLKLEIKDDGSYSIVGDRRSMIIDDRSAIRIRTTTFDMKRIDYLSYERYLAYKRIGEINDELAKMKEEPHG